MIDSGNLELIHGVGPSRAEELRELGLDTLEAIADAEPAMLAEVTGIGVEMAIDLRRSAARLVGDDSRGLPDGAVLDFGNPHDVVLRFETVQALDLAIEGTETGSVPPAGSPVSRFHTDPAAPSVGETIRFDASSALGDIDTYAWDFDFDGGFTPAVETGDAVITNTFDRAGDREIALAVTDVHGRTDRISRQVTVGLPEAGEAVAFPLEREREQQHGKLFRLTTDNQQFEGESALPAGTEISIAVTDHPGGIKFLFEDVTVEDDGHVTATLDLSPLHHGTYFVEARRGTDIVGRRKVAVSREWGEPL
jgi:hypothetical protein